MSPHHMEAPAFEGPERREREPGRRHTGFNDPASEGGQFCPLVKAVTGGCVYPRGGELDSTCWRRGSKAMSEQKYCHGWLLLENAISHVKERIQWAR